IINLYWLVAFTLAFCFSFFLSLLLLSFFLFLFFLFHHFSNRIQLLVCKSCCKCLNIIFTWLSGICSSCFFGCISCLIAGRAWRDFSRAAQIFNFFIILCRRLSLSRRLLL